ncbi:hypothetical protein C8A03DRAFT_47773 [Achaetomium macrosporum]|uniref:3'(2'),5'-bisphosphate nucleotidase n=1 Tax=Achaetomium macrosporum TaxID=79813 RepID=A0AAN7H7C8_9PEZI|nr:hypothetical protein C8A03DRAFT_47773 [Achaetomium macrosporum]
MSSRRSEREDPRRRPADPASVQRHTGATARERPDSARNARALGPTTPNRPPPSPTTSGTTNLPLRPASGVAPRPSSGGGGGASRPPPAKLVYELHIAELAVQRAALATKAVLAKLHRSSSSSSKRGGSGGGSGGPISQYQHSSSNNSTSLAKQDDSPVTIADFAAQALLISGLAKAFPDDGFLGEEDASALRDPKNKDMLAKVWELVDRTSLRDARSEAKLGKPRDVKEMLAFLDRGQEDGKRRGRRYWVMDPVDGTSAFMKGGQYAIALALVQDGVELIGVLACPNLRFEPTMVPGAPGQRRDWMIQEFEADLEGYGLMLAAVKAGGATVRPMGDGPLLKSMRVDRSRGATPVARSRDAGRAEGPLGGLHFVDSKNSPKTLWTKVQHLAGPSYYSATQLYSSHMRYAAMVLGARDFVQVRWPNKLDAKWSIWDHVGSPLIYTESGPGTVTDMHGRPIKYDEGHKLKSYWGIITADASVYKDVLAAVQEALAQDSKGRERSSRR